jgi:alpha-beta hydrolase superfamily lysophospholipase
MVFSIFRGRWKVERFIGVLLVFLPACSSLLYAPTRVWHLNPTRIGIPYETVSLDTVNHGRPARIHGWWFRQSAHPRPKGFLLFFHGNGENRSSHFFSLAWILEHGYDFFIFDYAGYGDSDGDPSPESTVTDGMVALRWFFETGNSPRYHGVPLIIFAQSLGGAVALRALLEVNESGKIPPGLTKVILDSTFVSYQKAGASVLSQHWLTFPLQPLSWLLLSDRWAPANKLHSLPKAEYFVIHGEKDRMIQVRLGQELYDSLPEPKKWFLIPEAGHIQALFVDSGKYRETFLELLK